MFLPTNINIIDDPIIIEVDQSYTMSVKVPDFHCAFEMSTVFTGGKISFSYVNDDNKTIKSDIHAGRPVSFTNNVFPGEFDLTLSASESQVTVFLCVVSFMDMHCERVELRKTIVRNPTYGTIGFDFKNALLVAQGWEKIRSKVVNLRMPNGHISTIKKTTTNFIWHNDILCCELPVGKYSVRIRFTGSHSGQMPWSKWVSFRHSRKFAQANGMELRKSINIKRGEREREDHRIRSTLRRLRRLKKIQKNGV